MNKKLKEFLKGTAELIVVAVVTYILFTCVVRPVRIIGSSMMNTVADQDMALMDSIGLKQNGVERFDVVVVNCEALNEVIIKRVIGLPGETIEYRNDRLYVNGVYVKETFFDKDFVEDSKEMYQSKQFTHNFSVQLKDGEYFVMGDNRLNSKDSRMLGAFKLEDFMGKNGFVIYPFDHFGWIND